MENNLDDQLTVLASAMAVLYDRKDSETAINELRKGIIDDLKSKSKEAILTKEIIENIDVDINTAKIWAFGVVCLKQKLHHQPFLSDLIRKPRNIEEDHAEALKANNETAP